MCSCCQPELDYMDDEGNRWIYKLDGPTLKRRLVSGNIWKELTIEDWASMSQNHHDFISEMT